MNRELRKNKENGAIFRQSLRDFPCPVMLGKTAPSFGLHRFNQGLRFIPLDDEGFTLRGDKRRLLYKGIRRSHRFTILGDTSFEYDCILERPPESNVISLLIEGAENFDFFRQPDFVPEPFLKGSYAVYKKEIFVGEGTGKLCHIHRPEIIDARGRRCWGELSVVGNMLHITIPEQWLGEAVYPVVVDPTIGTTTVGSQYRYESEPGNGLETLYFEFSIPVSRFLVSEKISGNCTAYFYVNEDDSDAGGRPVIYSENFSQPHLRKSSQESFVNMRVTNGNPKGWRNGTFKINDIINAGSYIWFGFFTEYYWYPRFDYGGNFWWEYWDDLDSIPNTYPYYKNSVQPSSPFNFKLSMYFNYTSSQSYIRTITQGVKLTDKQIIKCDFRRVKKESVYANTFSKAMFSYFAKIQEGINVISLNIHRGIYQRLLKENLNVIEIISHCGLIILRTIQEIISSSETMRHCKEIFREVFDNAEIESEVKRSMIFSVILSDTVRSIGSVFRGLLIFVKILTSLLVRDFVIWRFLISKKEIKIKSMVTKNLTFESKIH
jgi:hypothetical protein